LVPLKSVNAKFSANNLSKASKLKKRNNLYKKDKTQPKMMIANPLVKEDRLLWEPVSNFLFIKLFISGIALE
jgi:hypothetical protein